MPKANVYDMTGKQVGEIELSEAVFGIEPNESVVHDVVKNQRKMQSSVLIVENL